MSGTMPWSTVCSFSDGVRRLPVIRINKPPPAMMIVVSQSKVLRVRAIYPFEWKGAESKTGLRVCGFSPT